MANNKRPRDRKKSSNDQKINLRSWKKNWQAETATLDEALSLRRRLVKCLRKGNDRERETARILDRCRRAMRCGSPECPVCERRRRRKAQRKRVTHTMPIVHQSAPTVILTRALDITPEKIEWLWPGTIASGRVTGLVGYPGLGKSQVAMDLAATVSSGHGWPGGITNERAGDVIVLAAEDDPADTIVPRLMAAGADRSHVHIVKAVKDGAGGERSFNLASDLDRLEREKDLMHVRLVIIDPISAYLGSTRDKRINRNQGGDVRAIQDRLAAFAATHELAILSVAHLNKSSGTKAITRIMGSFEFVAAPRAVFLVTEEAGTDRRLFLPVKNNLAPDRFGYAFRIEDRIVAPDIKTSAVVWDHDPVTITADEALAAAAKKRSSGAIEFLEQVLSDGPVDQTEIVRLGKEAGFTEKNLRTAREELGIKSTKEGFGAEGKWIWVPAGGAQMLKLVVDNRANGHAVGTDEAALDNGHAQAPATVPEPGNPESGPEKPTEGDAT
jgi:hypothetical protein